MTAEGRQAIIEDLSGVGQRLREATRLVHNVLDRYLETKGLSMQQFMDQTATHYQSDGDQPVAKNLIQ